MGEGGEGGGNKSGVKPRTKCGNYLGRKESQSTSPTLGWSEWLGQLRGRYLRTHASSECLARTSIVRGTGRYNVPPPHTAMHYQYLRCASCDSKKMCRPAMSSRRCSSARSCGARKPSATNARSMAEMSCCSAIRRRNSQRVIEPR